MATSNQKATRLTPRPNEDADKKSPNYRAQISPPGEQAASAADGICHTTKPAGPPASAAENHDAANQKCAVNPPQTASKDEREKATG